MGLESVHIAKIDKELLNCEQLLFCNCLDLLNLGVYGVLEKEGNRTMKKTLLMISGPAAVGKRPFVDALAKRLGNAMEEVPVLAQRDPLFGETPPRGLRRLNTGELPALSANDYVLGRVRNRVNAVDLRDIAKALNRCELVVVVPFCRIACALAAHPRVLELKAREIRFITVFISPFSEDEIAVCTDQAEVLTVAMIGRDVDRTLAEKALSKFGKVTGFASRSAAYRSSTLLDELATRSQFNHVLVMHNGHLPSTWAADPPVGEAGKALERLLSILRD